MSSWVKSPMLDIYIKAEFCVDFISTNLGEIVKVLIEEEIIKKGRRHFNRWRTRWSESSVYLKQCLVFRADFVEGERSPKCFGILDTVDIKNIQFVDSRILQILAVRFH